MEDQMEAKEFKVDDLVWAKMQGYPPWPGKIVESTNKVKRLKTPNPQHFVFFFGTKNYAWILDEHITPHSRRMIKYSQNYKKKPATLLRAIKEIEKESLRKDKEDVGEEPSPKVKESNEMETPSGKEKQPEEKEEIVKTPKKATPKLSQKKIGPVKTEISPSPEKKRKVAKKRALPKEFETSMNIKMDLIRKQDYYTSLTVPPKNGFSKVAVIPPYNESSAFPGKIYLSDRHFYPRLPTPELDFTSPPKSRHQDMNIQPTSKKIGFLGLGMMGRGMVKNLISTGHKVMIWNRTESKCLPFAEAGAELADLPIKVVQECDIIFSCVSDPEVAKEVVFCNTGVLSGLSNCTGEPKGYVEMTSLDPNTSQEIAEAVADKGGRYLEAPIIGSRELAEGGELLILGAGDRDLFEDCQSCFYAIAQMAFYLSCEVGSGAKMRLILSMLTGTTLAAIGEAVALVEKCNMSTENFLEVLGYSPFAHQLFMDKSRAMVNNQFIIGTALKHQQKDMALSIGIGHSVEQPLPLTVAANEVYKRAKQLRYADHDVAAVCLVGKM